MKQQRIKALTIVSATSSRVDGESAMSNNKLIQVVNPKTLSCSARQGERERRKDEKDFGLNGLGFMPLSREAVCLLYAFFFLVYNDSVNF